MSQIVIRGMTAADLPRLNEIHNQRDVAAMTLQMLHTTVAEREQRFANSHHDRMLVAEIDNVVVGVGSLQVLQRPRRNHVGNIGMGIDAVYHGRGVGTALLEALLDLADNWHNLRRVELEVYTDNDRAIRLYQRFGFVIEGTHRAYAYRDGDWADAYSMARLRNEPPVVDGAEYGLHRHDSGA